MKKILILSIFIQAGLFLGTFVQAQDQQSTNTVRIIVEGLKSNTGGVELTLFEKKEEKHFPIHPEHALKKEYKNLNGQSKIEFTFQNLPKGEYAAFAFHDEDGNKKINTNLIGIPSEGYGATQGATNKFGPPKYADAKFQTESEKNVTIKVAY